MLTSQHAVIPDSSFSSPGNDFTKNFTMPLLFFGGKENQCSEFNVKHKVIILKSAVWNFYRAILLSIYLYLSI